MARVVAALGNSVANAVLLAKPLPATLEPPTAASNRKEKEAW